MMKMVHHFRHCQLFKVRVVISLLCLGCSSLPPSARAQENEAPRWELHLSPSLGYRTNALADEKPSLSWGLGSSTLLSFRKSAIRGLIGMQLQVFSHQHETTPLRWGSQHNGNGGFDPGLPSGENGTAVIFRNSCYYAEIPLGLRFLLGTSQKFFLQPGLAPAYFLFRRYTVQYQYKDLPDTRERDVVRDGDQRSFNLHASLGVGWATGLRSGHVLIFMPIAGMQLLHPAGNARSVSHFYYMGLRMGLGF